MNELLQALEQFIGMIEQGLFIPPPDQSFIGNYTPVLDNLREKHRDEYGILNQLQSKSKPSDPDILDGGDSAQKTGVVSFCNSSFDIERLHFFEDGNGTAVRHPYQSPNNNNPNNFSRDQLLQFLAGCWRSSKYEIGDRLLHAHASRIPPFTCQNIAHLDGTFKQPPVGDLLAPHDIMYLNVCAGNKSAYLDLFGQFSLQVAIEVTPIDISHEYTALLIQSIVCGRLNHFVTVHPEYKENLKDYWGGWRNQMEVAEALIQVIEIELKRYDKIIPFPILLPVHLINFFLTLDIGAELQNWDVSKKAELLKRFAEAFLKDLQMQAKQLYLIGMEVIKFAEQVANEALKWVLSAIDFAKNIIENGVAFAVKVLFGFLDNNNGKMEDLFKQYSEYIINRLTENMKSIVDEGFYKADLTKLNDKCSAIQKEFGDYLTSKDLTKLGFVEHELYEAIEISERLGLPSLSTYTLLEAIQINVFYEKKKANPNYQQTINNGIKSGKEHYQSLLKNAFEAVDGHYSYISKTAYDKKTGELIGILGYKIFEGSKLIEEVHTNIKHDFGIIEYMETIRSNRKSQIEKEIFSPAREIIYNLN